METYGSFYRRHKDKLFGYLMRLTGDYQLASDIMQESFTRMLEHYGPESLNVRLLFTIARNGVFDDVRKKAHRKEQIGDIEEPSIDLEQQLLVREEYKKVMAAMQRLEETERDILALIVSSNLTYRDIAEITGISEANVKVKVHRARVKIKKMLTMGAK